MATKTFEELKQLAIQIRDEKTNKQNTATRVGTAMLEHINKLEQDYYAKNQTDEELKERDDKLTELGYNLIKLSNISNSGYGLQEGEIYYNTETKLLRKALKDGMWENIPFYDGAIYTYNNTLYIWNGTDLVEAQKEFIQELINKSLYTEYSFLNADLVKGYYNLTGEYAPNSYTDIESGWGCLLFEVIKGDNISIKTIGGNNGRAYAITDYNKKILLVADSNTNTTNNPFSYKVNENGYLYVNCTPENLESFSVKISRNKIVSNSDAIDRNKMKLIKLSNISSSGYGLSEGEIYYNTDTKILRKALKGGMWETIPFYDGAIYTYNGALYIWNGVDLIEAQKDFIQEYTYNYDYVTAKLYIPKNGSVMLAGASIAAANNGWFELACENKGITAINKGVGATNSMYFANSLYNFGLGNTRNDLPKNISTDEFENHDALIIMYVHDVDAFTLSPIKVGDVTYTGVELDNFSAEDYETKGIIPYVGETTTGAWLPQNYKAAAYDYIIKKYMTLCYNQKNNSNSKWYNVKSGKPAQIALCTYWDDSRRIISEAQRYLCKKWGFPLIAFDANIGFTKNKNNPATNQPNRNLYTEDGTHPLAGQDEWIQKKLAAIASQTFICL